MTPEIGQQFGTRTLIAIAGRNKWNHLLVTVECPCGKITTTTLSNIRRTTACVRCQAHTGRPRIPANTGDRYGSRVILREDGYIDTIHRAMLVRCDCGKEERVPFYRLRQGKGDRCLTCANRDKPRGSNGKLVKHDA